MKKTEKRQQHSFPFYCLFSYSYAVFSKTAQEWSFLTLWCRSIAVVLTPTRELVLPISFSALQEKNTNNENSTRFPVFALCCCYISLGYNTTAHEPDTDQSFEGISKAGKSCLWVGRI